LIEVHVMVADDERRFLERLEPLPPTNLNRVADPERWKHESAHEPPANPTHRPPARPRREASRLRLAFAFFYHRAQLGHGGPRRNLRIVDVDADLILDRRKQ